MDEVLVSPPAHLVAAVAVSGSRNTKHIVNWGLKKFIPEGITYFKFLHVRPVTSIILTPMGQCISIDQVRDDIAAGFRKEIERRVTEKLLPYKKLCTMRNVQVEIVLIESDDVETAIACEIHKSRMNKLVIGTSSRGIFSRGRSLSSRVSKSCPSFCTVYSVSKGNLSSIRPSDSEIDNSFSSNNSSHTSSSRTASEWTDQGSDDSYFNSTLFQAQQFQALSIINQNGQHKKMPSSGIIPQMSETSVVNDPSGHTVMEISYDDQQSDMNFEVEKLRLELRHTRGMYAVKQGEVINVSMKVNELQRNHLEEQLRLKQIMIKEKEAEELAIKEKHRYEAAKREANLLTHVTERKAEERKCIELRSAQEAQEKETLENALPGCIHQYQYRKFTWEEIVSATSKFSENLKIGMGACGTVYKCSFHHTTAAVKILHTKEPSRTKQFQQELEILSQIRHPHLLILLGACPERGCLLYEFMENGSLEDSLMRKTNTPALMWFERFRIAWEIASALVFLHSSKPKCIVHRDLKPANILLGRNNVSKIGDIGLATIIHENTLSTRYKYTAPVGTLCYIDPEYQRTGVVSPESDVYAFGMVILQLITGKSAMGLAHVVENTMENGHLSDALDPKAGVWPDEETRHLAGLALRCTAFRRIDRPDLGNEVLPFLEKMKQFAEKARDLIICAATPPNHFTCPILKEIMTDPCVAADGYTYDRKAIEAWLCEKDTSPMTNILMPHKFLIPNYTLFSAILDWKSGKE